MKTLLCLFLLLPLFASSQGQMLKFKISVVDDLGYPLPNVVVFAQGEYGQNPGDPDL